LDGFILWYGKQESIRISRSELETRNNRDFGDALIRAVFDEVSGAI
jgi:hypothetical protein